MADSDVDTRFADHWDASWAIADNGCYAVLARTRISLEAAPHAARAWIAASGLWQSHPLGFYSAATQPPYCLVTVNGLLMDVSQRQLVRGEAALVDLSDALTAGVNEISIEATYYDLPTMVGLVLPVRVALLFQADVEVPGEALLRLATGERRSLMRIMPTRPAIASSTWEVFARRTADGPWDTRAAGFLHPLAASPLLRLPRRGGALERGADESLPAFRHEHLRARAPLHLEPGASKLVDFGEELVGHLTVEGDGPLRVTLAPGESELEARDFDERTENPLRPAGLVGSGTWRDPRRSALRYVAVRNDGAAPILVEMGLDAFEIALECRGEFRSADPLLDQIYEAGRRTVLRCTHDFVEDGPKRDRLLWLGDLAATADVFGLTIGDLRPLRRSLLLAASIQLRNGALPGVGPHPNDLVLADYIPQWILAVRAYVLHSADFDAATLLLPALRRAVQYLAERIGPEGLVGPEEETDWWVFLDWDRREPFGSPIAKRGYVVVLSLMTAAALDAAADIAGWLGRERDGAPWRLQAQWLREQVAERAWNEDARAIVDWVRGGERTRHVSRFTTAWALLAGLGDATRRAAMVDLLAHRAGRAEPTTTGYGQAYNVAALFEARHPEVALALVRRYWGGMLERGASTFWESFDPDEDRRTELDLYGRRYGVSRCHGWSGSIAGTLATHVLGASIREPGGRRVTLRPQLGNLAWVEGTIPTPVGLLRVRWTPGGARVEVPAGMRTDVVWRERTARARRRYACAVVAGRPFVEHVSCGGRVLRREVLLHARLHGTLSGPCSEVPDLPGFRHFVGETVAVLEPEVWRRRPHLAIGRRSKPFCGRALKSAGVIPRRPMKPTSAPSCAVVRNGVRQLPEQYSPFPAGPNRGSVVLNAHLPEAVIVKRSPTLTSTPVSVHRAGTLIVAATQGAV